MGPAARSGATPTAISYRAREMVRLHVSSTAPRFDLTSCATAASRPPCLSVERHCHALAGHARSMLGRGLRLGADVRFQYRRRLAFRRVPHHADGARSATAADPLPPSVHCRPACRQETRPHPAGRGDRHLDCLQHLGRIEPLPGHHRAQPRPIRHHGQHRAALLPRLRHAAAGCAARAAGDLRCRRPRRRAIRIWNGPMPMAIPRNTPRRAGRATTAISSAGPSARATRSISPASTSCISPRKSSTAMTASSSSAMTNTGPGKCATRSTPMSSAAGMWRALPAISCGRRGWKTRAGGRSATNTAPAPKTRPIAAATSRRATNSWEAPEIGRPGALTFGLNATARRLCRLGRLRAARRARLPDLPAGALGLCRHRPLLRRPARRRQPCLRLRGRRARLRSSAAACPSRRQTAARRRAWKSWPSAWRARSRKAPISRRRPVSSATRTARFTAEMLYGEASDANIDKVKRGNGMIVNFQRGKGEVFHAGSCEWVAGLLRRDAMVETVTANVLDRYLGTLTEFHVQADHADQSKPNDPGTRPLASLLRDAPAPAAGRPRRRHLSLDAGRAALHRRVERADGRSISATATAMCSTP